VLVWPREKATDEHLRHKPKGNTTLVRFFADGSVSWAAPNTLRPWNHSKHMKMKKKSDVRLAYKEAVDHIARKRTVKDIGGGAGGDSEEEEEEEEEEDEEEEAEMEEEENDGHGATEAGSARKHLNDEKEDAKTKPRKSVNTSDLGGQPDDDEEEEEDNDDRDGGGDNGGDGNFEIEADKDDDVAPMEEEKEAQPKPIHRKRRRKRPTEKGHDSDSNNHAKQQTSKKRKQKGKPRRDPSRPGARTPASRVAPQAKLQSSRGKSGSLKEIGRPDAIRSARAGDKRRKPFVPSQRIPRRKKRKPAAAEDMGRANEDAESKEHSSHAAEPLDEVPLDEADQLDQDLKKLDNEIKKYESKIASANRRRNQQREKVKAERNRVARLEREYRRMKEDNDTNEMWVKNGSVKKEMSEGQTGQTSKASNAQANTKGPNDSQRTAVSSDGDGNAATKVEDGNPVVVKAEPANDSKSSPADSEGIKTDAAKAKSEQPSKTDDRTSGPSKVKAEPGVEQPEPKTAKTEPETETETKLAASGEAGSSKDSEISPTVKKEDEAGQQRKKSETEDDGGNKKAKEEHESAAMEEDEASNEKGDKAMMGDGVADSDGQNNTEGSETNAKVTAAGQKGGSDE